MFCGKNVIYLDKVSCALEKNVNSAVLGWNSLYISIKSIGLMYHLRPVFSYWVSLMPQLVKNAPAKKETQETPILSLGWENPMEEENGNSLQCSWFKIPTDRGACGLLPKGSQRVRHDWVTRHTHKTHFPIDFLSKWSVHWCRWSVKLLHYCQFLSLHLLSFALC